MRFADITLLNDLSQRVKTLEQQVLDLQEKLAYKPQTIEIPASSETEPPPQASGPKMCPKCGIEPARGLHVKFCRGRVSIRDDILR